MHIQENQSTYFCTSNLPPKTRSHIIGCSESVQQDPMRFILSIWDVLQILNRKNYILEDHYHSIMTKYLKNIQAVAQTEQTAARWAHNSTKLRQVNRRSPIPTVKMHTIEGTLKNKLLIKHRLRKAADNSTINGMKYLGTRCNSYARQVDCGKT